MLVWGRELPLGRVGFDLTLVKVATGWGKDCDCASVSCFWSLFVLLPVTFGTIDDGQVVLMDLWSEVFLPMLEGG